MGLRGPLNSRSGNNHIRSRRYIMKRLVIIISMACLIGIGAYGCGPGSSSGENSGTTKKLGASAEKQIKDFNNQSTKKDRRNTGGPPDDRTISGLNGLKVD